MYGEFGLFMGGAWRPASGGHAMPVFSPVTEAILGEVPTASAGEYLSEKSYVSPQSGKWWEGSPQEHGFTASI